LASIDIFADPCSSLCSPELETLSVVHVDSASLLARSLRNAKEAHIRDMSCCLTFEASSFATAYCLDFYIIIMASIFTSLAGSLSSSFRIVSSEVPVPLSPPHPIAQDTCRVLFVGYGRLICAAYRVTSVNHPKSASSALHVVATGAIPAEFGSVGLLMTVSYHILEQHV
jgi:hypothetical protein